MLNLEEAIKKIAGNAVENWFHDQMRGSTSWCGPLYENESDIVALIFEESESKILLKTKEIVEDKLTKLKENWALAVSGKFNFL